MTRIQTILLLIVICIVHAVDVLCRPINAYAAKTKPAISQRCDGSQLKIQNCSFRIGDLRLNVTASRIMVANQVARWLLPTPAPGKIPRTWREFRYFTWEQHQFLDFRQWAHEASQVNYESLYWHLIEVTPQGLREYPGQVLQRRRRKNNQGPWLYDPQLEPKLMIQNSELWLDLNGTQSRLVPLSLASSSTEQKQQINSSQQNNQEAQKHP